MTRPRVIWKYPLTGGQAMELTLPFDESRWPVVHHVDFDPSSGLPALWIEHDLPGGNTGDPTVVMRVRAITTGGYVEPGWLFVGTILRPDGLVFHLFTWGVPRV